MIEQVIASCVRIEQEGGEIFLVFKVTDPEFKKRVKQEWVKDIPLQLKGYDLNKKFLNISKEF